MKQLTTLIVAAAVAATTFQVHADGENKMVIETPDGATSVAVKDIKKITFDGMTMTLNTADGDTQMDLHQVSRIHFDLEALSTDVITKDFDDGVTITANCGVVTVSSATDRPIAVSVYSLGGQAVASASGVNTVSIDLNTLPKGVYIVSAAGKNVKFTR